MQSIINLKLLFLSNNVRKTFLSLSNVFIENLYTKILYLLLFIFLMTIFSYNFVNYKIRLAFSNVVKIKKFEYMYIDIYLIQIYYYSKRQSDFRKISELIFIYFAFYFFKYIVSS